VTSFTIDSGNTDFTVSSPSCTAGSCDYTVTMTETASKTFSDTAYSYYVTAEAADSSFSTASNTENSASTDVTITRSCLMTDASSSLQKTF
jgi:hypothetical protein